MPKDISIVISFNNEEKNIEILYDKLKRVLESTNKKYELIFIDDGSNDNSYMELCNIYQKDKCVNIIKLRSNFGQTVGLVVGMNFAQAETIITMDGDLQHDPADIPRLLDKISLSYDLVNGKKIKRVDNLFIRVIPSLLAKRLTTFIFRLNYCDINSTFRAYRSEILHDIKQCGEMVRFLPLIAQERKINFCEVEIQCNRRKFGKTHYGLRGRLKRLVKDIFLLLYLRKREVRRETINLNCLVGELKFHENIL